MEDRPNRYQRRVHRRKTDAAIWAALLTTVVLFGCAFCALSSPLTTALYQQVLASNSQITLAQAQQAWLLQYLEPLVIGFVITAIALTVVYSRLMRKHSSFDFGEADVMVSPVAPASPFGIFRPRAPSLYRLSPRHFEEAVARIIAGQGYQTRVVGGAGDQGVDVKVFNQSGQLVGVVQCKRYRPNKALAPGFVREMATVRQMHGVSIAYLATTAYFTEETKALAKQLDVRLIDGHDLKQISKSGVPIQPPPSQQFPMPPPVYLPPSAQPSIANDPHAPFRPPPYRTEQQRVQEQLEERRRRLNPPKS